MMVSSAMAQHGCEQRALAQTEVGCVHACRCGKLHLVVGFVTLHFDAAGLAAMHTLLERALSALGRDQRQARENLALLLGRIDLATMDDEPN